MIVFALLVGLAFVVYAPVLGFGFISLCDPEVLRNPAVREFSWRAIRTLWTTYDPKIYTPLTLFTYQIQHSLTGLNGFWFHFVNVALHALNSWLVYRLTLSLNGKRPFAVIACLVFLLHPQQVESVAWVISRKDLLATLFFLLGLLSYLKYLDSAARRPYYTTLALFGLALLSKPMALAFPLVLSLLDDRAARPWRSSLWPEKLPFLALALVFGIIALIGWGPEVFRPYPLSSRILVAGESLATYLGRFFYPVALSIIYPPPEPITLASPRFLFSWVAILAVFAAAWAMRRKSREFTFALFFFLVTLAPTFPLSTSHPMLYAMDHYGYLPSFGLIYGLVAACDHWVRSRLGERRGLGVAACLAVVGVLGIFTGMSRAQVSAWKDSEAVYENTIRHYPGVPEAHNNLGVLYQEQGRLQDAERCFRQAVAVRNGPSVARQNLAAVVEMQGRFHEAAAEYRRVLEENPGLKEAHYGLANTSVKLGDHDAAILQFVHVLRMDPRHARACYGLAYAYYGKGLMEPAELWIRRHLELEPDSVDGYTFYARLLERQGRLGGAVLKLREALKRDPQNPSLRQQLARLGKGIGD